MNSATDLYSMVSRETRKLSVQMDLSKRIKDLRGTRSVRECAEAVGVTRSAWYQWEEKGDDQSILAENALKIAAFFGITVEEFLDKNSHAHLTAQNPIANYASDDLRHYNIRYYEGAQLSAGNGKHVEDGEPTTVSIPHWMIPDGIDPAMVVVAEIIGDSMFPTLKDGEKALVNTAEKRLKEGKIFAFNDNGELRVKKFVKRLGGGWFMRSDNSEYKDEVIAPHENEKLDMIGRVFTNIGRL